MCAGRPFKTKPVRINANSLLTPDVLKFHVPILMAFTPNDTLNMVDKKTGKFPVQPNRPRENLVSASAFKVNEECQKQLMNLNRCIKNIGMAHCSYYDNFLNRHCKRI